MAFELDAPDRARVSVPDGRTLAVGVRNVVDNAVEHNDADDPRVSVCVETDDDHVRIRVADNGPGLPQMEREVLRVGTESPLRHSSGLGLWTANWATAVAGGDLRFDDRDGGGTVVTLEFPRGPRPE